MQEYVYVAPDGSELVVNQLLDAMKMMADQGGSWKKRSVRK